MLLTTECKGKRSSLQITPNKQTGPGVKHDLHSPMVQSLIMPWLPMVILEMCQSPPGHSYSLAFQVGSSNSLVFIHLERESVGPNLIKAQEQEGKRRYVTNGERKLFMIESQLAYGLQ